MLSRNKVIDYLQRAIDQESNESSEITRFAEEMLIQIEFSNFEPDEDEETEDYGE